ncbi:hypothetical protein [Agrobacterium rubi]|uniref:hypothetical protein n=1 Tax=Agrobacterium rubi TaxID=28099 RepID=UPI001F422969|nr:hypothetical protein [Agrobacterium rubi]MBP1881631.1 putative membrane-bound spermidine synthase [Agrobacterium rubi]
MGVTEEVTGVGKPEASLGLFSRKAPILVTGKGSAFLDRRIFLVLDSVKKAGFAVFIFHKEIRNIWAELGFELQWQAKPSDDSRIDVENAA